MRASAPPELPPESRYRPLSSLPSAAGTGTGPGVPATVDEALLDAYSRTVSWVAAELLPSVVALGTLASSGQPLGTGSGVMIASDGLVVTSAHVVEGGRGGTAVLVNGDEVSFDVVGADRPSDLAVLRAAGSGYQAARLGDAGRLRVGQLVVAIGNPLGFSGSVSAGVVSALGRNLVTGDHRGRYLSADLVQTDAALHPGNSGGALANSAAEVVAINTALVGPSVGQGLGMATALNDRAHAIIGALAAGRRVRRAHLGIAGRSRPLPRAVTAPVGAHRGIELVSVEPSGPAGKAGLRPGYVIVSIEGQPVRDVGELQAVLTERFIGRPASIGYLRQSRSATCAATCDELPAR